MLAASFMLLLYAILHQTEAARHGGYWRLAHALSFPSFSLYAIHVPLCILLAAFFETHVLLLSRHAILLSGVVFAFVLVCTALFYVAFERNTNLLRRYLEAYFLFRPQVEGRTIRST